MRRRVSFLLLFVVEILAESSFSQTTANHNSAVDMWDIYHPLDEGLWKHHQKESIALTNNNNNKINNNPHQAVKLSQHTPKGHNQTKRHTKQHKLIHDDNTDNELQEEDIIVEDQLRNLRSDLRLAEIDSLRLFSKTPLRDDVMQPMIYSIFKTGRSALRDMKEQDRHLLHPETLFGLVSSRHSNDLDDDDNNNLRTQQQTQQQTNSLTGCRPAHYRACAALLLLRGYPDVAHELLLGVTPHNLLEAEYAATHRGQTTWADDHPLSDTADMLHAAIHRIVEGHALGEGNASGFDNAKYWLAGGPKLLDAPAPHSVRASLARIARLHTPHCVAVGRVIAASEVDAHYTVLSGGGKTRTVHVPPGQWDDFAFLELCQQWADGLLEDNKDLEDEVATLQRAEIILLLRHELMQCLSKSSGGSSGSMAPTID